MQRFTLADASRLHSANGVRNRDCQFVEKVIQSATLCRHGAEVPQVNGPVTVDGVLNNKGLTVSLHSPDSGSILSERTCIRFDDRELCVTGDIPGHNHGHCEVLEGETNEGLGLVIESHRSYAADPEGNARARKVCVTIRRPNPR